MSDGQNRPENSEEHVVAAVGRTMAVRKLIGPWCIDFALANVCLWLSYFTRYGSVTDPSVVNLVGMSVPLGVIAVFLLTWRGLYAVIPSYYDLRDMLNVIGVCVVVGFFAAIGETAIDLPPTTRGLWLAPILYTFILGSSLCTARLINRAVSLSREGHVKHSVAKKRTLVVGGGRAGEIVIRELARLPRSEYRVVAIVDDDVQKHMTRIHGVPVMGRISDIPAVVKRMGIEQVLILLPSASGELIRRVVNLVADTPARIRVLPSVVSLIHPEKQLSNQLRDVDITDLLRREPVAVDIEKASQYIAGEHVMITGGGGSIGSELARQIAKLKPASLILLGKGENSLYEIEQELVHAHGFFPTCVIADVRDEPVMRRIMETYRPGIVFHAAAHKHVPLMQSNVYEAVMNNVYGTQVVADLSAKYGVKKFILISSDKAVRPSSVMGATKRVCELIVASMSQEFETEFAVVRFGNVLGSRGSLIPLIKSQIMRGGPVTVTHRDMTRFFMTIPEAVQLIVEAGAMGKNGEVFILDMGEPVRVYDLVVDLIRLHGLEPGEDIPIEITGIRPGEKLHEELIYDKESLADTPNPKIKAVLGHQQVDSAWLRRDVQTLIEMCKSGSFEQAKQFLMEIAWQKSSLLTRAVVADTINDPVGKTNNDT